MGVLSWETLRFNTDTKQNEPYAGVVYRRGRFLSVSGGLGVQTAKYAMRESPALLLDVDRR